jgi:hypothetical protein
MVWLFFGILAKIDRIFVPRLKTSDNTWSERIDSPGMDLINQRMKLPGGAFAGNVSFPYHLHILLWFISMKGRATGIMAFKYLHKLALYLDPPSNLAHQKSSFGSRHITSN